MNWTSSGHRGCFLGVFGYAEGSPAHMVDGIVNYEGKSYKRTLRGVGLNIFTSKNWSYVKSDGLQVIEIAFWRFLGALGVSSSPGK